MKPTQGEAPPVEVQPHSNRGPITIACGCTRLVPIDELKVHPKNPNKHDVDQIELYADAIHRNGWRRPVVVSTLSGLVIRGHGAIMAARLLEMEVVPVEFQEYGTEAEELADLVADNELARLSKSDKALIKAIAAQVTEDDPTAALGISQERLAALLGAAGEEGEQEPAPTQAGADPNETPYTPPTSQPRLVQLVLTTETHPAFMDKLRQIASIRSTTNITETVLCAVDGYHHQLTSSKPQ